jgi:serine protease
MYRLRLAVFGAVAIAILGVTGAVASDHGADGKVQSMRPLHGARPTGAASTTNLTYHGGTAGVGVETAPKVYVVYWGSGWASDPSGEAPYLNNFLGGLGSTSGETWSTSTTQFCQGVASGSINCATASAPNKITQPATIFSASTNVWFDTSSAPSRPRQRDLAAEAVRAAAHFGNTAGGSNNSVQYVIATAHGRSASGFGTQYCAWHSSVNSAYGNIAYTNLPYMTDAGASCGQSFVNAGSAGLLDGVSIVEGHEYAETVTDQYPSSGWLDSGGAENADKCAWISSSQGGSGNIALNTGTFAVQSLWSNATSNCVMSYP